MTDNYEVFEQEVYEIQEDLNIWEHDEDDLRELVNYKIGRRNILDCPC